MKTTHLRHSDLHVKQSRIQGPIPVLPINFVINIILPPAQTNGIILFSKQVSSVGLYVYEV